MRALYAVRQPAEPRSRTIDSFGGVSAAPDHSLRCHGAAPPSSPGKRPRHASREKGRARGCDGRRWGGKGGGGVGGWRYPARTPPGTYAFSIPLIRTRTHARAHAHNVETAVGRAAVRRLPIDARRGNRQAPVGHACRAFDHHKLARGLDEALLCLKLKPHRLRPCVRVCVTAGRELGLRGLGVGGCCVELVAVFCARACVRV